MIRDFFGFFLALVVGLAIVAAVPAAPRTDLSWEPCRSDSDQVILWSRGSRGEWIQLGNYRVSTDTYVPLVNDSWGEPCNPPVPVPDAYRKVAENFGVQSITPSRSERWIRNGVEVSGDEAKAAIGGPAAVPDDAKLPFVVWIGDEATGNQVQAATKAAGVAPSRFQSYRPDDVMIRDRDGKPVYTPGLWVVTADGKVMGHEATYRGPDAVAEGLRRATDGFDPNKVPDLTKPAIPSLPDVPVESVPLGEMVGGAAIAVGGLLAYRKVKG